MAPLLLFLVCFLSLVLVFLLLAYVLLIHQPLRDHLFFKSQGISCAPFIPIFGHLPGLFRYESEDRNLDYWKDQVRLYGQVHAITLGTATSLKIDDPHYLKQLLRTKNALYEPSVISRMYHTHTHTHTAAPHVTYAVVHPHTSHPSHPSLPPSSLSPFLPGTSTSTWASRTSSSQRGKSTRGTDGRSTRRSGMTTWWTWWS